MQEELEISGLLTDSDINVIKQRYGINVNTDDVDQYKLCQVVRHLEERIRELETD